MFFLSSFTSIEEDLLNEIKNSEEMITIIQKFIVDWPKYKEGKKDDVKKAERVVERILSKKKVDEFDMMQCVWLYDELETMEELHKEDFEKIEKVKKRIELCKKCIEMLKDVILIAKEIEETEVIL